MDVSVRVKVPSGLATTWVPMPVSWPMVTDWPVAFACADADSVGLSRVAEDSGRSLGDAAWRDGVGALVEA
ncbi:hypothetical protein [Streptomyces sp. NPDC048663]|uniref:hypothetical protein n=1 Tax=Streptomyces sp. NPDC048663 TaxID=3155638 RepID=UPI0034458D76